MIILLKQAKVICSSSRYHLQVVDILIENGIITTIEKCIELVPDVVIDVENLHVSLGWVELMADFSDPGYEFRETIYTGTNAAAAGGFTDVFILPNTSPVNSGKAQTEYLIQKGATSPVTIHPLGSITKNAEGKELAEMYDMLASGAVAFTDGYAPVQNQALLIKAMQYHLATGRTLIQIPAANAFNKSALVNEGITSTRLGLPGMPAVAEELSIARDIALANYTGGKLHISGVSTAKGLQQILEAKKTNNNISCSVTPQHLFFSDEVLEEYDTNYKLLPPLRTQADKTFLLEAAMSGKIDAFTSQHSPKHSDEKDCEFEYAAFGNTGIETLFATLQLAGIPLEIIVETLSQNPRKIFDLPVPEIEIGQQATLTIFEPNKAYLYNSDNDASISSNSAFNGFNLKGIIHSIINKGIYTPNSNF